MHKNSQTIFIYTFYRFKKILNKIKLKRDLEIILKNKLVKGTVLLANEGINASISGKRSDLDEIVKEIKKLLKIKSLQIKINSNEFLPFNRMKVRLKKEIVSLGAGKFSVQNKNYIPPLKWNDIISKENIKLIDVRNEYEIKIGKFKNAINPKTKNFREFPKKFKDLKISKNDKIALYCTGGIRCEKVSVFLKNKGYKNVVQLEGGILNYIDMNNNIKGQSMWKGECFVFDDRVSVNKKLRKGNFYQCYGCRSPISKSEMMLSSYKKGVSCKYCINKKSSSQIKSLITRQNQIDQNKLQKTKDNFQKIFKV